MAAVGKRFMLGFMEGKENVGPSPIQIFVTPTTYLPTTFTITTSELSSPGINTTYALPANTTKNVILDHGLRMMGTSYDKKGIFIVSDQDITVQGVTQERTSTDSYLALPVHTLGTLYYVTCWYPTDFYCQFLIVGVVDGTCVHVRFPSVNHSPVTWNGTQYGTGSVLTIMMDRYDSFQIQSTGELTGTKIWSSQSLAVFSGNSHTSVTSSYKDHLLEMLLPVSVWGIYYIAMPFPSYHEDYYVKVVGSTNDTEVLYTVNNNPVTTVLAVDGDFVQITVPKDKYCVVDANKPVSAIHIIQGPPSGQSYSDPSMMSLIPISQFANSFSFQTPPSSTTNFYHYYFVFIMPNSATNKLVIDGNVNTVSVTDIPGTAYVSGSVLVGFGSHTVSLTQQGMTIGGYLYGEAYYESFSAPAGMRMNALNTVRSYSA